MAHASRWTILSLLILLGTTGCAGTGAVSSEDDRARMEEIFRARRDSAQTQFTKADVDFMTGMIAHHAQALVMSAMAPTHGAGEELQTLAARIINAQKDEIASMQRWLRDRGQPVPEIHIDGTHLMVHGAGDHVHHMPGMLTQEQIEELDEARGAEFERLFLEYMIGHHMGAVTMVEELFDTEGAGQDRATFRLASDIHVEQITEIERMKRMLEARRGTSDDR